MAIAALTPSRASLQQAVVSPYAAQRCPIARMALRRASAFPGPHPSGRFLTPLQSASANASSLVIELQPQFKQEASEADVVVETGAVLAPSAEPATSAPAPSESSQQPGAAAQPSVAVPFETDKKKLWLAAIKPPMYSVGFMPVLVSATRAASWADRGGQIHPCGGVVGSCCWGRAPNDGWACVGPARCSFGLGVPCTDQTNNRNRTRPAASMHPPSSWPQSADTPKPFILHTPHTRPTHPPHATLQHRSPPPPHSTCTAACPGAAWVAW